MGGAGGLRPLGGAADATRVEVMLVAGTVQAAVKQGVVGHVAASRVVCAHDVVI